MATVIIIVLLLIIAAALVPALAALFWGVGGIVVLAATLQLWGGVDIFSVIGAGGILVIGAIVIGLVALARWEGGARVKQRKAHVSRIAEQAGLANDEAFKETADTILDECGDDKGKRNKRLAALIEKHEGEKILTGEFAE